jgi:23S rRNA pseudouridine2605 synthase
MRPKKKGRNRPTTKRERDFNRDRIRSLRENREERAKHLKEMAQRMGIAPVQRAADPADGERLHVRIAHAGFCSRRAAERLIEEGRVTVNGDVVTGMGVKVSDSDEIRVDGERIGTAKHFTVVMYKPTGVVTTLSDPQGRPTIVRYLPDLGVQLKPVGRLDMDTEGLLLCTNDGELANRLTHPRFGVDKEYQVVVKGVLNEQAVERLRKGVYIEGRKTAPAVVEVVHAEAKTDSTSLRITIHEGRKRQIRLMCDAVGYPVTALKRVRIGSLRLKGMRAGQAKLLGKKEVDILRAEVGLPPS